MSKVITFSRGYPGYHPKAKEDTFFAEKIWASFAQLGIPTEQYKNQFIWPRGWFDQKFEPKGHTIRAGHRFKVGEKFSPRVWSGKPYKSRQIRIGPDIEIAKLWDIEFDGDGCLWVYSENEGNDVIDSVAKNDGLTKEDLYAWFQQPFTGQIICWDPKIEY